jgi:indole-3-glycerol phosphate synthase
MILDTIAEATKIRVEHAKRELPLTKLKEMIYENGCVKSFNNRLAFAFEKSLRTNRNLIRNSQTVCDIYADKIAFICEVKKASPSKGIISEDFPYLDIATQYQAAGADAISVLTEPEFFKGSDQYLTEISNAVSIPVLRKDFTVDEYQIYEAKLIGADAVLLICSLLDTDTIKKFLRLCSELGLSALIEAHNEEEVFSAISAGARVLGVNNRNLQTFEVDINNSVRLRKMVPKDIIFVAESGIKTAEDMRILKEADVNAVLIGETLMRSPNKKEQLNLLRNSNKEF